MSMLNYTEIVENAALCTVPKNPLGLGILGKPPGDYSNGRDLTLTVRGYSLAIMSTST